MIHDSRLIIADGASITQKDQPTTRILGSTSNYPFTHISFNLLIMENTLARMKTNDKYLSSVLRL